ncbi:hypothetical protein CAPTEDRAFT_120997 [Capitella teleta]|uniref:VWFA domain-containing protein n=1 Tax=Capitella teleta TaxID=283909 RepID=R7VGI7_CAPTE|nr:hypothetical protein CAPTEDRAFT_120997 [Capitella teleta]|eukprot:ELU15431.1 hypothetical protein CAPTEDRAFT_120997 [Capitella teleta]
MFITGQPDNWRTILEFVQEIVRGLNVGKDGTHVAVISYGNNAKLDFNLDEYYDINELVEAVGNVAYRGGNTNTTAAALRYCRETMFTEANGDRKDSPNLVVVVTDGGSNDKDITIDEAYKVSSTMPAILA